MLCDLLGLLPNPPDESQRWRTGSKRKLTWNKGKIGKDRESIKKSINQPKWNQSNHNWAMDELEVTPDTTWHNSIWICSWYCGSCKNPSQYTEFKCPQKLQRREVPWSSCALKSLLKLTTSACLSCVYHVFITFPVSHTPWHQWHHTLSQGVPWCSPRPHRKRKAECWKPVQRTDSYRFIQIQHLWKHLWGLGTLESCDLEIAL